jgi:hypothetical protein
MALLTLELAEVTTLIFPDRGQAGYLGFGLRFQTLATVLVDRVKELMEPE